MLREYQCHHLWAPPLVPQTPSCRGHGAEQTTWGSWKPETPKMEPLNMARETRQFAEPIKVTYMTVDNKALEVAAVGKSFKQSVQGLHGHVIHV